MTKDYLFQCSSIAENIPQVSSKGLYSYQADRDKSPVITHGNGHQVGNLLLAVESAKHIVSSMSLDICGAVTQGFMWQRPCGKSNTG